MDTVLLVVKSKTFWAGLGLVCLAVYQFTQGDTSHGFESLMAGFAAWGLRHAIAKGG